MESHDGFSQVLAYVGTVLIAGLTGIIKYLQRFTATPRPPFEWVVFVIQVATSILAGFIASWLFTAWHADSSLSKAAIAIAGWGGAEFIAAAERRFRRQAEGAPDDYAAH